MKNKMLQDLPLFTVSMSRALAREFPMCRGNEIPLTLFGASSTDYHPCIVFAEIRKNNTLLIYALETAKINDKNVKKRKRE